MRGGEGAARARRERGAGLLRACAMYLWACRPPQSLGTRDGTARWRRLSWISTADSGAAGSELGLEDPGDRGARGAAGGRVCGPGAGPGVGGRDWRLLLRAARAVSSLEPRCRRAARAGVPLSPAAGGAAALPPPRLPPFSAPSLADRHAALDVKAL